MLTLSEKISSLAISSTAGVKTALFWVNVISTHGEQKAEAFYKSLGLNHIEKKGVEWEGLTLSREPTEAEKICVKGIAGAQESSKEKIGKILLELRTQLISDGLKGIKKLVPATYHELTLQASTEIRTSLRDRLIKVHEQGRLLVARELDRQQGKAWIAEPAWQHPSDFDFVHRCNRFKDDDGLDEFDDLDTLTDLTDARVVNDVQSRITAAATRYRLLGLAEDALWAAIAQEMADGSVSYIDRAAQGLANRVISIGRGDEMRSRADEIERYEYSALLDANTCEPCLADDGKEGASPNELPDTPNPDCEGSDFCRCFIVAIAEGNM